MKNLIDHISISNFKSIRNLKLDGLSRINLFIGKPNVGKSNILEALGVFSLPYLKYNSSKKLTNFIRADYLNELFFDGNTENQIIIKNNLGEFGFSYNLVDNISPLDTNLKIQDVNAIISIEKDLTVTILGNDIDKNPFKYYNFKTNQKPKRNNLSNLLPPAGTNLMEIVENLPTLKKDLIQLFNEYNLSLVFDRASQELKIMKEQKGKEIFLIPYKSIADTLQRVIFYKTAIASNQNSILIFEEPEAHAFPPYIIHITREIIEAKSNQFVISTHSPYILDYFLENAMDELSIFMVDYKDGETIANKLSKEDMEDIQRYGIDLFTNYETFLK
ncbi:MAG: AAA family ATPase [Bacteroidota bacterium]|nr:AAA family ATPase [Bacteroidota bacterium]